MKFQFKQENQLTQADLFMLYNSVGWTSYTKDLAKLQRAVANSQAVITVWLRAELVGLIRTIGDQETILYIENLLVKPEYQHQGLGTELIQQVLKRNSGIRQVVLLTDNTVKTRAFYEKQGLTNIDKLGIVAFYQEY
ncbi:GNAT family N-acetyltransferase [Lactobacillus sp. ESL0684]|uniref:GNAT family N-acetyltransferase n=1 Tax=Lactobacillus sp. ESL0684 TaxID=2983213 RepID=UPI0023F978DB|nr:GNAT family N-acetyltransferase [Lactobacillus sp. ESL0684]WEV44386.1 GNAT family N-acetyltransferase [Lactobacillus sp. ESL0684]